MAGFFRSLRKWCVFWLEENLRRKERARREGGPGHPARSFCPSPRRPALSGLHRQRPAFCPHSRFPHPDPLGRRALAGRASDGDEDARNRRSLRTASCAVREVRRVVRRIISISRISPTPRNTYRYAWDRGCTAGDCRSKGSSRDSACRVRPSRASSSRWRRGCRLR